MRTARGLAGGFLSSPAVAVSFLTVLPVAPRDSAGPAGVERSIAWFPLVGALVGGLAGSVRLLAEPALGAPVGSRAGVGRVRRRDRQRCTRTGWPTAPTASACTATAARRLEAMRDSAVGAFGILALLAWALLFLTALSVARRRSTPCRRSSPLAPSSRWAALLHAAATPAARADGLGAAFDPKPGRSRSPRCSRWRSRSWSAGRCRASPLSARRS